MDRQQTVIEVDVVSQDVEVTFDCVCGERHHLTLERPECNCYCSRRYQLEVRLTLKGYWPGEEVNYG